MKINIDDFEFEIVYENNDSYLTIFKKNDRFINDGYSFNYGYDYVNRLFIDTQDIDKLIQLLQKTKKYLILK